MSIAKKMTGVLLAASLCSFAGPVSHFGKLVSCGANICGEKTGTSTPIQLKGPSLFWSTGDPAVLFDPVTVEWFAVNFNIGVIRAPMAIKYYGENKDPISESDGNKGVTSYGYLSTGTEYKALTKNLIKKIVDAAIENDVYVIVDWHSHNAHQETSEAVAFFKEMATEYKDVPNVIWEIYNEPVSAGAGQINSYAESVSAAIRNAGSENLIIVGSSSWSSQPGQQAGQGLHNKYKNIAYTLHFYAGTGAHDGYKSNIPDNAPTFVTEWGASAADGGQNQTTVSDASGWRSWMDQKKLSGCMWFAGTNGNGQNGTTVQSSAMFPYGTNTTNLDATLSSFSGTNTTAGVFAAYMSTNKWTSFVPSSHPMGNTIKASVAEGASKTFSSTDLGLRGTISEVTTNSGTVTKTDNSITFKSAEYGSPDKVIINYSVTSGGVTVKERINGYKKMLTDYHDKYLKRGSIEPSDTLIIAVNYRMIEKVAAEGQNLYRSVSDLIAYATGAAACTTSDLMLVLASINLSLDNIELHLNKAYFDTWRYIQMRMGYWKAQIYNTKTRQEIINDAFGRWRESSYKAIGIQ